MPNNNCVFVYGQCHYVQGGPKSKPQTICVYDVNNTTYVRKKTDILYVTQMTARYIKLFCWLNVIYFMVLSKPIHAFKRHIQNELELGTQLKYTLL